MEAKNINALTFLIQQNKYIQEKQTKTKNVCILMMASIIHGWQRAFSEKYRRSSKILTETAFKALFTTQKPRIYVPIENQLKKL